MSSVYVNTLTKLEFECKEGHVWEMTPNKIQQGAWCGMCARAAMRTPLQVIQALAADRGGVCLSTEYTDKTVPLQFQCARGHVFGLRMHAFKNRGHWCKYCRRHTLEEMQETAATRGGKCLSTEYVNSKTHLLWECADGHQWKAAPGHVYNSGTWCRICSRGKSRKVIKRKIADELLLFGKN